MKTVLKTIGGLMFGVFAFLFFVPWDFTMAALKKPIDVYDNDLTKVPRYAAVECDIDLLLDCFGTIERKSVNSSTGAVSPKGTSYYYALPFNTQDDVYFVAISVDSSKHNTYDNIVDSSYSWLMEEKDELDVSRHFMGAMKKLDDEMYGYMKEMLLDQGFVESEAEAEKYVLPLSIKEVEDFNKTRTIVFLALMVVGALLFVAGLAIKEKDE